MPNPSRTFRLAPAPLISTAVVALLLTGCASVALPPAAPPSSISAPAPATDDSLRYPPPQPRIWTQPPVDTPMEPPTGTPVAPPPPAELSPLTAPLAARSAASAAAANLTPAPPPASLPAPPRSDASATLQAHAQAPGAGVGHAAGATARPVAGRWSVQVGVFAVEANATAWRARVMQRLAGDAQMLSVHAAQRDGRTHVLVGDVPDRASAMQLAARLRTLLQQDTVLFRW